MARLNRLIVPHEPHHILQKAVAQQTIFKDSQDYLTFLSYLTTAVQKFTLSLHAYVLMPTHYHCLITVEDKTQLSKMMQWLGRHYVTYFNQKYQQQGTLWQGRFKSNLIEATHYLIPCMQYIESHPLRHNLVTTLDTYPWSSYLHHSGIQKNPIITEHTVYWAIANTPFAREAAYRQLINIGLMPSDLALITQSILKGWALGSSEFKAQIEKKMQQRVQPAKRGRPRLQKND